MDNRVYQLRTPPSSRMQAINNQLAQRLVQAEQAAETAASQAAHAVSTLKNFLRQGTDMPPPPQSLPSGGTLSLQRFRKTLTVLRQAHSALLSQAQLLRIACARGVSMEEFDYQVQQRNSSAGAGDVLRFIRAHCRKLVQELHGLPGASPEVDSAVGIHRGQLLEPQPAGFEQLVLGLGEQIRGLRNLSPDQFLADAVFEVNIEQLAELAQLLVDEVDRLQGNAKHGTAKRGAKGVEGGEEVPSATTFAPSTPAALPPVWEEGPEQAIEQVQAPELDEAEEDMPNRRVQVHDLLTALDAVLRKQSVTMHDLFQRFDCNKDGRLQPTELKAFVTAVLGKASDREHRYLLVMLGR
ncbi:hypothetical protein QJQ45_000600 [Haematococcus lacustris]|nr:hypothetical protein QJQ45_000600 [Haematococcus lacustris]